MLKVDSSNKNFLLILISLAIIYIFPIITGDVYYADDLVYAINNSNIDYATFYLGRPLAYYMYKFINLGNKTLNPGAWFQIIAIISLVFSAIIVAKRLKLSLTITSALGMFIFMANPFLLESFSYKIAASQLVGCILIATIAASLNKDRFMPALIKGIIFIIIILSFYQIAINIFIGLTIIYFISDVKNNINPKKALLNVLIAILQLIIGYALYYIFIYKPMLSLNLSWYSNVSMLPIKLSSIGVFINNIKSVFVKSILVFLSTAYSKLVFIPMFIISYVVIISYALKYIKLHGLKYLTIICFIVVLFSPCLIIIASYANIVFMQNAPIIVRTFHGFAIILLFITLGFLWLAESKYNIVKKYIGYLLLIPIYYLLTINYVNYAALRAQAQFETYIINNIVNDVNNLNIAKNIDYVSVYGKEPIAPNALANVSKFNIIPVEDITAINYHYIAIRLLATSMFPKADLSNNVPYLIDKIKKSPILKANNLYSIRLLDNHILIISFHENSENRY